MALADKTKCPICRCEADTGHRIGADVRQIECPRCGAFDVVGSAFVSLKSFTFEDRQRANASGWLREHQNVELSTRDVAFLESVRTPTIHERASKLLLALNAHFPSIGERFQIDFRSSDILPWEGISWSTDRTEVEYLLCEFLHRQGYIGGTIVGAGDGPRMLTKGLITPKGYEEIDRLRGSGIDSVIGFCAMWFDPTVLPVWTEAIEPAIREAGYQPQRIDFHEHNNRIDDAIIASIRKSRFIVADFTGNRGGVYFEAGFAYGLGLPVIWTIENGQFEQIHFDNRQYNFLDWNREKHPDFAKRLRNRIEATIGQGPLPG